MHKLVLAFSIKKCGGEPIFTRNIEEIKDKSESGKLHAKSDPRLEALLDGKVLCGMLDGGFKWHQCPMD